jgi:hypothetical protein
MMQVSKRWREITTSDRIWQAIGEKLGATFSIHMPNPKSFKFERPKDLFNDKLLSKSMVHLHTQIYPKADRTIVTDYYQNHISLPAPSKMEQVLDIYAQATVKAYYGVYSHFDLKEEILPLLGSLDIKDIILLKQINEANDCLLLWKRIAWACQVEASIPIPSLETLLAIPEDLMRWCTIHAEVLSKIENLDLQLCKLSILPNIFGYLPNLKFLELRINNLTQLPDSIGKLTKLRMLSLVGNQLTKLPNSMRNLTQLCNLNLNENDLSELPYWIGELVNLSELNIDHNHLTCLPHTIEYLTKLRTLTLEGNKLVNVPESIGSLKNLDYLRLSDNSLETLPNSVENMKKLVSLLLDGNQLTLMKLPRGIWSLPLMRTLTLENSWSCNFWDYKRKLQNL